MNPVHVATTLTWSPAIGGLTATVLILAALFVLRRGWRVLRARCGRRRAAGLCVLRAALLMLLFLALTDPACERDQAIGPARRIALLTDGSSSMHVPDAPGVTRLERAETLRQSWRHQFPDVEFDRYEWDTRLLPTAATPPVAGAEDAIRATDFNAVMHAAADDPRIDGADVVVVLTDGGDDPPVPLRLPGAPLLVVGFGTDPAQWRDVAVADIRAPARIRPGARFAMEVELDARDAGDAAFRAALETVVVRLFRETPGGDLPVETRTVDLRGGTAVIRFELDAPDASEMIWRFEAEPVDGELSALNNTRRISVQPDRETLNVLYFALEIGAGVKFLRRELSADPAIAFHALFPVSETVWTLQGEARNWPEMAGARGLPTDADALRRFDCLILGPIAAGGWDAVQAQAVQDYVEQGGGLILVGGESAFDPVAVATLGSLMPWAPPVGDPFVRLPAEVVPPSRPGSRADLWETLRSVLSDASPGVMPTIGAYNRTGPLKAGATVWLEAAVPQGRIPLLAEQTFGRGRVFALATNTTWLWAMSPPPLDRAYRRFWRTLVRAAAGRTGERRGGLRVWFDAGLVRTGVPRPFEVEVLERPGASRLAAQLTGPSGTQSLALNPHGELPGRFRGTVACERQGPHVLRIEVRRNGQVETWESAFDPARRLEEGAHLACDSDAWLRWAASTGATYFPESRAEEAGVWLRRNLAPPVRTLRRAWTSSGPLFALIVLAVWLLECYARRRMNLI